MGIEYDYDEESAKKADDAASRITETGAYIGEFVRAEATTSANTGTHGIVMAFDSPGNGNAEFTLWTKKSDDNGGAFVFGKAQVDAMMFLLGLKGSLKSVVGKVSKWEDTGAGGRELVEGDGDTFPDLCKKKIGVVLQKERYSKQGGGEGTRMGLVGLFDPTTKLMMSEIKERKTVPVKLDRLLKGLKDKDSRKAQADEPAQPAIGAAAGEY